MSVRRLLAGVAATSLAATVLAVAAPAQADPSSVPDADDIVGAGSDTSMFALTYLAEGNAGVAGYNASNPARRLVSFDAKTFAADGVTQTNSATVEIRPGVSITRPNGSTEGKNLLRTGGNTNVNYARSSSSISSAEASDGLVGFPFAKDTLAMATAKTSNAPAALTEAQIVDIYEGDLTNWATIGGNNGVIKPYIPQSGSGTRSFFVAELKRMNNGVDVAINNSVVVPAQEHSDAPIKDDANAVAPFSVGRAGLLGTLRIESGFTAARALYNIVRQPDVSSDWAQAMFGPNGFACSPAATSLILDAGFEQLLSQSQGGKCGVTTTSSTAVSDLLTAKVNTTTTVAGTSATAGAATLTATISGGGQLKPQGVVAFAVDGVTKGQAVVTGGKATANLTGLTAGAHQVKATFTPTGAAFNGSTSAEVVVTVKAADTTPVVTKATTKLTETFKAAYPKGAVIKGKVKVKESATGSAAGKVVIKVGTKTVGKGSVKNGVAVIKLTKPLKKGKNKLVAQYAGNSAFAASKLKFVIKIS